MQIVASSLLGILETKTNGSHREKILALKVLTDVEIWQVS